MKILPSNKKGGTDGAYYMFICWKQKEVESFTFPTETSGRWATIGQSCEQSRTPTYVGFGRAFIPATTYVFWLACECVLKYGVNVRLCQFTKIPRVQIVKSTLVKNKWKQFNPNNVWTHTQQKWRTKLWFHIKLQ